MAQGIVTVMSGNEVLMKVVAGCNCNGRNTKQMAEWLKASWPITVKNVYCMSLKFNFGEKNCLVVITDSEIYSKGDGELSSLYRETFQQPKFNPRWKRGTGGHVVVIKV